MYLRKSRADLEAEARGEGETLARHFQILTRLADQLGLSIPPGAVYREIVSGDTIAARPMMQRLLQEVADGKWQGVLCTEVERLARGDTIDQGIVAQTFKSSGTRIITPQKTYDPRNEMDEEFFEFSLFMARREYKAINRRLQAGRAASVREGHYVGARRPFGYRVVRCANNRGYTLEQIPEEAAIVRMVYDWYLNSSLSKHEIARRLNALGVKTSFGREWTDHSIRAMLNQPVLAGFVRWNARQNYAASGMPAQANGVKRPKSPNEILVRGLHEPIISPEIYQAARDRAAALRTSMPATNKPISSPLAGLLRCAICGRTMVRKPEKYGIFVCCRTDRCPCSAASLDVVLSMVLDTLRAWLHDYQGQALPAAPAAPDYSKEIALARAAIETAKRQLNAARDLLEQGIYAADEYLERRATLTAKIESATSELHRLEAEAANPPADPNAQIIRLLPDIQRVLSAWPLAQTPQEQRALLASVLSSVDYQKTAHLYRNQDPRPYITLTLHPISR